MDYTVCMKHLEQTGPEVLYQIGEAVTEWQKVMPQYAAATSRIFHRSPVPWVAANQEVDLSIRLGDTRPDEILKRMGPGLQSMLAEDIVTGLVNKQLDGLRYGEPIRTGARRASAQVLREGVQLCHIPKDLINYLELTSPKRNAVMSEDIAAYFNGMRRENMPVGRVYNGRLGGIYTVPEMGGLLLARQFPASIVAIAGLVGRDALPNVDLKLR